MGKRKNSTSKRKPPPSERKKKSDAKSNHRVHGKKTLKGHGYEFTDKHHGHPKGDHACWSSDIARDTEFEMFQEAETGEFHDDDANLYNVLLDGEAYIEIGTRSELLAIFWNPHSASDWHGHPMWPIKTRGAFNRKNEQYRPPKEAIQKMVTKDKISQRDANRILRGDYP